VADISWLSGNIASGGTMTYLFWRSAYLSMCFSSKFNTSRINPRD
jgi:NADH:ubiquinone reductase (non-electrogenic)